MTVAAPAAWEGQAGTGGTDGVEAGNRCQPCLRERAHEEEKEKGKKPTNATGDESKLDFFFPFWFLCAAKFDFAGLVFESWIKGARLLSFSAQLWQILF